ncbi:MAG: inositol monophosphatase family protein [Myxococcota bacterium]
MRRFGSAGLDLAYVACGRFDYYWESGLKPWDVAGGALLVEEAGGVVSDSFGGGFDPERGDIAVAGRGLHRQLLDALTLARERPINDRCAELKPDGIDNT